MRDARCAHTELRHRVQSALDVQRESLGRERHAARGEARDAEDDRLGVRIVAHAVAIRHDGTIAHERIHCSWDLTCAQTELVRLAVHRVGE